MSDISIIENTFFANGRYWGGLNSSLYKCGSIWAMKTGIDSADLNWVWNEKTLTTGDLKTIQGIKKHFQKTGLPFRWWVFPIAQTRASIDILEAENFSFVESVPSLLAELNNLAADHYCTGLQIMQIQNKETLFLWEEVSFAGFDFEPETRQQYHQFLDTFNFHPDSPQKFYLASLHGRPVATSLLFLHENAGGIYFVSTRAEYRKKGIGLALIRATMLAAKEAGARYATLQSSPDGFGVYLQAGFKECCRVDAYELKAV